MLTITRPLRRSRPEPTKPGGVECAWCFRQMGRAGALNRSRSWRGGCGRPTLARSLGARCGGAGWPGSGDDRARGGDRRRRPDRADAGGRAGVGGDRRRHRRTARQPGARRLASRGSARPHHRGARSAGRRGTIPLRGAGPSLRGLRRDLLGHQRLPHPPQLHPWPLAEPLRAHPGRLGRRARGSDPSPLRGGGLRPGRHRRRCRAVRRHVAASGVPRRVRRRTQPDPQGGRHRLPRVGPDDQLHDRRGRDGRGAGDRHAPRGWWHRSRQPGGGRRAVPGRPAREGGRPHPRAHHGGPPRGARRRLRDGLRGAQPHLDLPVHRHDPAGGVLPRGTGAARRRRRPRAWPRKVGRASTPACRMP